VITSGQQLVVEDRPAPVAGEGELLVEVHAAGLNGADLMQRAGNYPPPPGAPVDVPGLELAGIVVETGPGTVRFSPGDRVMSITAGGAQAELALVADSVAMAVPDGVSFEAAGGFPEVFTTAHDALVTQCALAPGETLLVNGAAGGVGIAGVQLGVLYGAEVVASVRRAELRDRVAALGAAALDPTLVAGGGPYDVVLELVGAPNLAEDLETLRTRGRIVVIGVGGGSKTEIDLRQIMGKRAVLRGSTLRARSVEDKAAAARKVEQEVVPAFADGRIAVPIEQVFSLEDVEAAYERFAAGGKFGKIVLSTTSH
jgi:NADPH2:quinone reductase